MSRTGAFRPAGLRSPCRSILAWLEHRGGALEELVLPRRIDHAGDNRRAVQILHGHTKREDIMRYPGVDVEDALALSEGAEV